MSYTPEDLTAVRQAKRDLIAGKRVGSVQVRGRTIKYQEASLDEMTILERQIVKALRTKGRKRYVTVQYSKGV